MATGLLINESSDKTLQLKVDSSPNQAPLNKTPKQQGPSANSNPAPENKLAERSVYSQDKQPEQKLPKELEHGRATTEGVHKSRSKVSSTYSPFPLGSPEKQKSLDTNSTRTSTSVESSPSKTPGISEALAETSRFFNLPTSTAGTLTEEGSNGHDGGKSILPFAKLCERYSYIGKFFGFEPSQYPNVVSFAIETLYNTGEDPDRDIISKLCEDEDHWRKFNHERNLFFLFYYQTDQQERINLLRTLKGLSLKARKFFFSIDTQNRDLIYFQVDNSLHDTFTPSEITAKIITAWNKIIEQKEEELNELVLTIPATESAKNSHSAELSKLMKRQDNTKEDDKIRYSKNMMLSMDKILNVTRKKFNRLKQLVVTFPYTQRIEFNPDIKCFILRPALSETFRYFPQNKGDFPSRMDQLNNYFDLINNTFIHMSPTIKSGLTIRELTAPFASFTLRGDPTIEISPSTVLKNHLDSCREPFCEMIPLKESLIPYSRAPTVEIQGAMFFHSATEPKEKIPQDSTQLIIKHIIQICSRCSVQTHSSFDCPSQKCKYCSSLEHTGPQCAVFKSM